VLLDPCDEFLFGNQKTVPDLKRGEIFFMEQLVAAGDRDAQCARNGLRIQKERQFLVGFVDRIFDRFVPPCRNICWVGLYRAGRMIWVSTFFLTVGLF